MTTSTMGDGEDDNDDNDDDDNNQTLFFRPTDYAPGAVMCVTNRIIFEYNIYLLSLL